MTAFRVLAAVVLVASLLSSVMAAQEVSPVPVPPEPAVWETREFESERELTVLTTGLKVGTNAADVVGTNGELWLQATGSAFPSGVLLRAFAATPNVFAQLGTNTSASAFQVTNASGGTVMKIQGDGNVGIGTASPVEKLHVLGNGVLQNLDPSAYALLRFNGATSTSGMVYAMGTNYTAQPNTASDAGTFGVMAYETGGLSFTSANATNGSIRFYTAGSGSGSERLRITQAGTVGIGTSTPNASAKLHVNGNVLTTGTLTVTGNIAATGSITGATVVGAIYQDLAEWVPASSNMEPGTVVVLNHDRTNEVMPSHRAYDTSVAGVVSAQPGILLGIASDSKEQIATTGRVKVRVDANRGAIRVGDLLVTSDVPGTAMKSIPLDLGGIPIHRPGTIIGKALEPLESGEGEILVLLSMQ